MHVATKKNILLKKYYGVHTYTLNLLIPSIQNILILLYEVVYLSTCRSTYRRGTCSTSSTVRVWYTHTYDHNSFFLIRYLNLKSVKIILLLFPFTINGIYLLYGYPYYIIHIITIKLYLDLLYLQFISGSFFLTIVLLHHAPFNTMVFYFLVLSILRQQVHDPLQLPFHHQFLQYLVIVLIQHVFDLLFPYHHNKDYQPKEYHAILKVQLIYLILHSL